MQPPRRPSSPSASLPALAAGLALLLFTGCDDVRVDAREIKENLQDKWEGVHDYTVERATEFREALGERIDHLEDELDRARRELAENEELQAQLEEAREALKKLGQELRREGGGAWREARDGGEEAWREVRDELARAYEEVAALLREIWEEIK